MATIGKQLSAARRKLGLTVGDVVHATKINSNVIRSIEDDDFSLFPSTTYARSFLRKYSEHLQIDVSEEIQALQEGTAVSLKDTAVMDEIRDTLQNSNELKVKQPRRFRRRVEKPGGAPLFLGFILALLFICFGVFYFLGYNAESPEEVKGEIAKNLSKAGELLKEEGEGELVSVTKDGIEPNPLKALQNARKEKSEDLVESPKQLPKEREEKPKEKEKTDSPIKKPEISLKLEETPLEGAQRSEQGGNGETALNPKREIPAIEIEDAEQPELTREDLPHVPGRESDSEPQIKRDVEGPPLNVKTQDGESGEDSETGEVPVTAGTQ